MEDVRTLDELSKKLTLVLSDYLSQVIVPAVLRTAVRRAVPDPKVVTMADRKNLLQQLQRSVNLYMANRTAFEKCSQQLEDVLLGDLPAPRPEDRLRTVQVKIDADIVTARAVVRDMCRTEGVARALEVTLATVISELARNIVLYAGSGVLTLTVLEGKPSVLQIQSIDSGPGIRDLASVLDGSYRSKTGMGLGLAYVRKVMDEVVIDSSPGKGTSITARKRLD
ncbi:MAG TPA: ATP-binding protein [Myxococcota bacterium]|nr:ATP-binding protein [Myxococcota bacterium]HRY95815.1 ATP-binding protein [Myxococcota bacterium]HSA23852.1 ATP-binding protein [Myxococcota bacterium]